MSYSTKHLVSMFSVSHQTIKNYAQEFAAYLSPTATPEKNHARVYTDEDLRVLDLVVTAKKAGRRYEEIHAMLQSGQRGDVPDMPANLAIGSQSRALSAALQRVSELEELLTQERSKRIGAEANITLLQNMLRDAHEEIIRLRSQK